MSNLSVHHEPAFQVIGLCTRTSNKENMTGNGPIAAIWQQFFRENTIEQIPNKIDDTLYVLYYDYASNKDGEYTFLLGIRVSSFDNIPLGMIGKQVPAEQRTTFLTPKGPLIAGIIQTWMSIWALEDEKRIYGVDYEMHDVRSQHPTEAQAEIHIGIH